MPRRHVGEMPRMPVEQNIPKNHNSLEIVKTELGPRRVACYYQSVKASTH